jgi:hypothetical protein
LSVTITANEPLSLLVCLTNSTALFLISSIRYYYTPVCSFVLITAKMKGKKQQQIPLFNIGAYCTSHCWSLFSLCFYDLN